jgi:hypothetical protein
MNLTKQELKTIIKEVLQEPATTEDKVDLEELRIGMAIELEHTNLPEVAKQIALDHLAEIPDYYTRLVDMEDEALKESTY